MSSNTRATLWFAGDETIELVKWRYEQPRLLAKARESIRGKAVTTNSSNGNFQWTSAAKAVALIFLNAKISNSAGHHLPQIEGGRGSLASSLDDAIYKDPQWLNDFFGTSSCGTSYAKRVFIRTNPGQKRPGPVVVFLNEAFLDPLEIDIYHNGVLLERTSELLQISTNIYNQPTKATCRKNSCCLEEQDADITDNESSTIDNVKRFISETPSIRPSASYFVTETVVKNQKTPLRFREDWLAIVSAIALETRSTLRGMVVNSEVDRWWTTAIGRIYMRSNIELIKKNKTVKRIFLVDNESEQAKLSTYLTAYLNSKIGVKTRVIDKSLFLERIDLSSNMFSVHDETFVALHCTDKANCTKLESRTSEVKRFIAHYDDFFEDSDIAIEASHFLKDFKKSPVIKREADKQLSLLKTLSL